MEIMKLYVCVKIFHMIMLFFLLIFFREIKCSIVIDSLDQKSIKYSDYCPKTQHCKEGAHVMCMFYDPKRKYGPRCHDPRNVTVTEEIVLTILDIINAIRSKAARGLEYGKDNQKLPRAYGMMRLDWDSELATFAQVSVDRCHLRHDLCRATKRFPNPSQMATQVRFQYPSWKYLHQNDNSDGLTPEKVIYAVKRPLRNFFLSKDRVAPDMIANYPDIEMNPKLASARAYLDMVHAQSTHIGCALSGYVEFFLLPPNDSRTEVYYNVVAMICNISSKPIVGSAVYNTTPPTGEGYSTICGCPPGTVEDEDCLCNDSPAIPIPKQPRCNKDGNNCKSPVFILPIITIEDAPPSMLQNKSILKRVTNETFYSHLSTLPIISKEIFEIPATGKASRKSHIDHVLDEIINGAPSHSKNSHSQNIKPVVRNHYYVKKSISPIIRQTHLPRSSIFSRSSIFELSAKKKNNSFNSVMKSVMKTVMPRKNFTNAKNLVSSYLNKSRNYYYRIHPKIWEEHPTGMLSNKTGEKVNNISSLVKDSTSMRKFSTNHDEIITSNNTTDQNLLTLLNKLEQEIKHIELHEDKKELIDAKIRKIYDILVEKPEALIFEVDHPEIKTFQNYLKSDSVHKSGQSVEQGYIDKYNSDYNHRLMPILQFSTENERNKNISIDVYDQNTENSFSHRKDTFSDYKDYDFRPVSIEKLSYSPLHRRDSRHYRELRKYKGHAEHGIERKNRRQSNAGKYDRYESSVRNDKYKKEELFLDEDLLSSDRKIYEYYHNKLKELEKTIQNARTPYQQEISERPIKPIKIPYSDYEMANRPSKSSLYPLYIQAKPLSPRSQTKRKTLKQFCQQMQHRSPNIKGLKRKLLNTYLQL